MKIYEIISESKVLELNDDDWYEIDLESNSIVAHHSRDRYKAPPGAREIKLSDTRIAQRGLRAKHRPGLTPL